MVSNMQEDGSGNLRCTPSPLGSTWNNSRFWPPLSCAGCLSSSWKFLDQRPLGFLVLFQPLHYESGARGCE